VELKTLFRWQKTLSEPARHTGLFLQTHGFIIRLNQLCVALMYDPQGDKEIIATQELIRNKIDE
jgi:hypothetical protein